MVHRTAVFQFVAFLSAPPGGISSVKLRNMAMKLQIFMFGLASSRTPPSLLKMLLFPTFRGFWRDLGGSISQTPSNVSPQVYPHTFLSKSFHTYCQDLIKRQKALIYYLPLGMAGACTETLDSCWSRSVGPI